MILSTTPSILFPGQVMLYPSGFRGFTTVLKKAPINKWFFNCYCCFQDIKNDCVYRQVGTQSQGSDIQCIINHGLFAESSLSDFIPLGLYLFSNSKQLLSSFCLWNPQADVILPLPWATNNLSSGSLVFSSWPWSFWEQWHMVSWTCTAISTITGVQCKMLMGTSKFTTSKEAVQKKRCQENPLSICFVLWKGVWLAIPQNFDVRADFFNPGKHLKPLRFVSVLPWVAELE